MTLKARIITIIIRCIHTLNGKHNTMLYMWTYCVIVLQEHMKARIRRTKVLLSKAGAGYALFASDCSKLEKGKGRTP